MLVESAVMDCLAEDATHRGSAQGMLFQMNSMKTLHRRVSTWKLMQDKGLVQLREGYDRYRGETKLHSVDTNVSW